MANFDYVEVRSYRAFLPSIGSADRWRVDLRGVLGVVIGHDMDEAEALMLAQRVDRAIREALMPAIEDDTASEALARHWDAVED